VHTTVIDLNFLSGEAAAQLDVESYILKFRFMKMK
jgi:hypothetical protein